jgi:hypothetical protein
MRTRKSPIVVAAAVAVVGLLPDIGPTRRFMKRACALILVLFAVRTAAAQSELRYTSHMEVHPAGNTPAGAPTAPVAIDAVVVIGDHATRSESGRPEQGMLAGTISIHRDGTLVVLNVPNKTYMTETLTAPDPDVFRRKSAQYTRTGEFANIAGVRAERVTFSMVVTVHVPGSPERDLDSTGEVWLTTDQFQGYAANVAGGGPAGISLYDTASMPAGFPMKSVIRGGYFGAAEIQLTVTSIAEEPVQPALFAPPPDYREVPPGSAFFNSPSDTK